MNVSPGARPPNLRDATRAFLYPVLALAVIVAACAAGGEVLVRLLGAGAPNYFLVQDPTLYVADSDPLISYRLRPGYRGVTYHRWTTINERGMRDDPVPAVKPAGEFRLLALGDSVLFGIGAGDDETYARALQRALTPPAGFASVRVLNLGVPGYNTVQQARLLEREGDALAPDGVLVLYCLNDPEGIRPLRADGYLDVSPVPPHFPELPDMEPIKFARRWSRLVRLVNRALSGRARAEATARYHDFYRRGVFEDPPDGWVASQRALAAIRSWTAQRGIGALVVVSPILDALDDHPFTPAYERVAAACAAIGLPAFVPELEAFRAVPLSTRLAHPEDGHPGPGGYALLAEQTARYLAAHLEILSVTAPAGLPGR